MMNGFPKALMLLLSGKRIEQSLISVCAQGGRKALVLGSFDFRCDSVYDFLLNFYIFLSILYHMYKHRIDGKGRMHRVNKVNYQIQLDKILDRLKEENAAPRLLLHSCCAPCSSYVLEYLSNYFRITVFYYNPNISPEREYIQRVQELRRLIGEMPFRYPVCFQEGAYEPDRFYEMAKGMEHLPEGQERCFACYRLRLQEAALAGKEGNYDYFTTTLSISPLKNAQKLNEIGNQVGEERGIAYLPSDFKKRGGYNRSLELSAQYHLYRQNYCGCVFSKRED